MSSPELTSVSKRVTFNEDVLKEKQQPNESIEKVKKGTSDLITSTAPSLSAPALLRRNSYKSSATNRRLTAELQRVCDESKRKVENGKIWDELNKVKTMDPSDEVTAKTLALAPRFLAMGMSYLEGTYEGKTVPTSEDDVKPYVYIAQAAKLGLPEAASQLAGYYLDCGEECLKRKEEAEAFEYVKQAADLGSPEALCKLAYFYLHKIGTEQNFTEIFKNCKAAAEKGLPEGEYKLSVCYRNGWGTPQSETSADMWLQKAADHGYSYAQRARDAIKGQ